MASGSGLDRFMRDQAVHFKNLDDIAATEAVVETLIEKMREMDGQEPGALADLAHELVFGFARQNGATIDRASELARSIANRVRGEAQARRRQDSN